MSCTTFAGNPPPAWSAITSLARNGRGILPDSWAEGLCPAGDEADGLCRTEVLAGTTAPGPAGAPLAAVGGIAVSTAVPAGACAAPARLALPAVFAASPPAGALAVWASCATALGRTEGEEKKRIRMGRSTIEDDGAAQFDIGGLLRAGTTTPSTRSSILEFAARKFPLPSYTAAWPPAHAGDSPDVPRREGLSPALLALCGLRFLHGRRPHRRTSPSLPRARRRATAHPQGS